MKIILDERTPQKLRLLIDNRHIVVTTWFQGWSGFKNGALLAAAEEAGFDLLHHGGSGTQLSAEPDQSANRAACFEHEQPGSGQGANGEDCSGYRRHNSRKLRFR
jgi:hypothetical protein